MNSITDPAAYEAWYHSPRGRWIGDREFVLMQSLLRAGAGATLLDVGCGTGYFSRRFAQPGLSITGVDSDPAVLNFAMEHKGNIHYLQGSAQELPFPDAAFDYTIAVTSLCFIDDPGQALQEIWRVTGQTMVLGLLNRHSLLYQQKYGRGGYQGVRWDSIGEVANAWIPQLAPSPIKTTIRTAIYFPKGAWLAQWIETWFPSRLPWGGFIAVCLEKQSGND